MKVARDGGDYTFENYTDSDFTVQLGATLTLGDYGGSGADDWQYMLPFLSSGRGIGNQPNDFDVEPISLVFS